jgi:hypothetical protein
MEIDNNYGFGIQIYKPGQHLIYISGELSRLGRGPYILQNQYMALYTFARHSMLHGLDACQIPIC